MNGLRSKRQVMLSRVTWSRQTRNSTTWARNICNFPSAFGFVGFWFWCFRNEKEMKKWFFSRFGTKYIILMFLRVFMSTHETTPWCEGHQLFILILRGGMTTSYIAPWDWQPLLRTNQHAQSPESIWRASSQQWEMMDPSGWLLKKTKNCSQEQHLKLKITRNSS